MQLYRLTQKKYAQAPFDPIGARLFGGRWNSKGTDALYFAESESLCVLEVFVHLNHDANMVQQYDLYRIDLPNELIATLDREDLPTTWRAIPAGEATQAIGDQFLQAPELQFAALQVPSTISPRDYNYLINPHHPKLVDIFAASEKLAFEFDPRIFK